MNIGLNINQSNTYRINKPFKNKFLNNMTIYSCNWISDISFKDFLNIFIPKLHDIIKNDKDAHFSLLAKSGNDLKCLQFLLDHVESDKITVYHMSNTPHIYEFSWLSKRYDDIKYEGGYISWEDCNKAISQSSDMTVLWHIIDDWTII